MASTVVYCMECGRAAQWSPLDRNGWQHRTRSLDADHLIEKVSDPGVKPVLLGGNVRPEVTE